MRSAVNPWFYGTCVFLLRRLARRFRSLLHRILQRVSCPFDRLLEVFVSDLKVVRGSHSTAVSDPGADEAEAVTRDFC